MPRPMALDLTTKAVETTTEVDRDSNTDSEGMFDA